MSKECIDTILAIVQILTLLAVILYVFKTWQMASATKKAAYISQDMLQEMKEAREAENRPYIDVFVEITRNNILQLVICNNGKIGANNVNLKFEPEIDCIDGIKLRKLISDNFSCFPLHPKGEIKTFIDGINRYLIGNKFPPSYKVDVTYENAENNKKYYESKFINISMYEGMLVLEEKDLSAVVAKLDKIADNIRTLKLHS